MGIMQPKLLTAIYDLAVSPLTFDVVQFLVASEIERIREQASACHLVFVPEFPTEEHNQVLGSFEAENKHWRFRQITLPSVALMPSITQITVCADREEAAKLLTDQKGPRYPEGYSVEAPIAGFSIAEVEAAFLRGDSVPSLRAPRQAVDYVERWIEACCGGRKVVSITLRETSYGYDKNSDIDLWTKFAAAIDPKIYCPVFVRDTDGVFTQPLSSLSPFVQFPVAAVNIELRTALYENCYVNMIGSNGPSHICLFDSEITCITTNWATNSWFDTRPDAYRKFMGVEVGEQLPHSSWRQKLAWGPESFERAMIEFDEMARMLDGHERVDRIAVGQNFQGIVAERLLKDRQWGPARKLYRHLLSENPKNPMLHYGLGLCETWLHRPSAGLESFERALDAGMDTADLYCGMSEAYAFLGRTEQAVAGLIHAITLDPDHFDSLMRLATVLEAVDRLDEAKEAIERAVAICQDSADAYSLLAIIHKKLGATSEANKAAMQANHLRRATEEGPSTMVDHK